MSTVEALEAWLAEPGSARTTSASAASRSGRPAGRASTERRRDWLARLAPGPPCQAVQDCRDRGIKGLVTGERHQVLLQTTLRLVRLGQRGHAGVREVLEEFREVFVATTAPSRAGGRRETEAEWTRALAGAVQQVSRSEAPAPDACCLCRLALLWQAYHDDRFFTGGRFTCNERLVLRCLLHRVRCSSSTVVDESQRQIAEATDLHRPVVSRTLTRLHQLGWLEKRGTEAPGQATRRRVHLPPGADAVLTAPGSPSPAEYLGGNSRGVYTHPLFGKGGLGNGLQDVFGLLPEDRRGLATGAGRGYLVRTNPDATKTQGGADARVQRQLPAPRQLTAVTARDVADALQVSLKVARTRLARLEQAGLVFPTPPKGPAGRLWWRYRLDPDEVVARHSYTNTRALKAQRHQREREDRAKQLSAVPTRAFASADMSAASTAPL